MLHSQSNFLPCSLQHILVCCRYWRYMESVVWEGWNVVTTKIYFTNLFNNEERCTEKYWKWSKEDIQPNVDRKSICTYILEFNQYIKWRKLTKDGADSESFPKGKTKSVDEWLVVRYKLNNMRIVFKVNKIASSFYLLRENMSEIKTLVYLGR